MPMTPAAAKKYKPRRTPGSQDEVIYPETRAKMEEAKAEMQTVKLQPRQIKPTIFLHV
jgi:hypothetical protein